MNVFGNIDSSPIVDSFIPDSIRFFSSFFKKSLNKLNKSLISSEFLFQFSEEKANKVKNFICKSIAVLIIIFEISEETEEFYLCLTKKCTKKPIKIETEKVWKLVLFTFTDFQNFEELFLKM